MLRPSQAWSCFTCVVHAFSPGGSERPVKVPGTLSGTTAIVKSGPAPKLLSLYHRASYKRQYLPSKIFYPVEGIKQYTKQ